MVNAFSSVTDETFETVYYGGSEEDWDKIAIDELGNDVLFKNKNKNLNIIYNYTQENTTVSNIPGDANGDGKVNVADAVAVLQYIANRIKFPLDEQGLINADIDGSPGITGSDAIAIQKIDAGILVLN